MVQNVNYNPYQTGHTYPVKKRLVHLKFHLVDIFSLYVEATIYQEQSKYSQ